MEPEEVEDTLPRAVVAAARRRRRVRPLWFIAAGAVVALGIAGTCVAIALPAPGSASVSARATSHDVTLTGWGSTPTWTSAGVAGHLAVTSDGKTAAWASKKAVTIVDAKTGKARKTAHLSASPKGGVFAVTIGGHPGLVADTDSSVSGWYGSDATEVSAAIPKGGRLEIRTGTAFIVAGATVSMLTKDGASTLTSPRPGAAVLGTSTDGKILWASSRGEVITAAANGTVTRTVKLAPPTRGATITGWVTASNSSAWVRWRAKDGSARLVAHSVVSGSAVSGTDANPDGMTETSQSGKQLLVDGIVFDADGHLVRTPKDFIASRFIGDEVYGATRGGDAAVLEDGTARTSTLPTVVPTAITADRDLVTVTDGRIALYPRTTK